MQLRISENHRYISDQQGQPFFYLADTAWEMLHQLSEAETELYLSGRAAKGFTVIQTVILGEIQGLKLPNANGDLPFENMDPATPIEAFFAHVDWALRAAERHGLILGLLPTWGDKWHLSVGTESGIFTPENARIYGEYLGRRYAESPNIIWIIGGDRPIEEERHRAVNEAIATGLKAGGSSHLQTFHPHSSECSSRHFHNADWLDFNMLQTGHRRNSPNFERVTADYALTPTKPTLDGEPGYEDHKLGATPAEGYSDDYDCRKSLYWALFSGACGHTYGAHPIWQMWQKGRPGINHPRRTWQDALSLPGAEQMGFARKLHEKFPFLLGAPAQEMVLAQPTDADGEENNGLHVAAIRGANSDFALLYFPMNSPIEVRLDSLLGRTIQVSWFNPRDGEIESTEIIEKTDSHRFTPIHVARMGTRLDFNFRGGGVKQ